MYRLKIGKFFSKSKGGKSEHKKSNLNFATKTETWFAVNGWEKIAKIA